MLQGLLQVMKRPLDIRHLTIDLSLFFALVSVFGEVWLTSWYNLSEL